ncbi:hypothetical protein D1872_282400 [compost metagenome]
MQDFLTNELGADELFGMVGDLVFGIILRTLRQILADLFEQGVHVISQLGRDRHNFRKIIKLAVFFNDRKQFLRLDAVYFVQYQNNRSANILQPFDDEPVSAAQSFRGIDQE